MATWKTTARISIAPHPTKQLARTKVYVTSIDQGFAGWTAEELKHLSDLNEIQFFPTRFADDEVMRRMGIHDQVYDLLDRMQLKVLFDMDEITYPDLARHFLATVRYEENEDGESGNVHFRLYNYSYYMRFNAFCSTFGLPRSGRLSVPSEFTQASIVWSNIAIEEQFESQGTNMSKIRNPAIRYTNRLLGNTFYARAHPGFTMRDELYLMYDALRFNLQDHYGRSVPTIDFNNDVASMLLLHLMSMRSNLERYRDGIHIGGLLTPIFRKSLVDFSHHIDCGERRYMDEAYMMSTFTLAGRYNEHSLMYRLMDNDSTPQCCFLPNSRYSHTQTNDGIRFRLPEDQYFRVPRPQRFNPSGW